MIRCITQRHKRDTSFVPFSFYLVNGLLLIIMKYLVVLFSFCFLFACKEQEDKPAKGQELLERALSTHVKYNENRILRYNMDWPGDFMLEAAARKASALSPATFRYIDTLLSFNKYPKTERLKSSKLVFQQLSAIALDSLDQNTRSKYPALPEPSANVFENRLIILAYAGNTLDVLMNDLPAMCGITDYSNLKTLSGQTVLKKGEVFKCINIFEKDRDNISHEGALNLKKITRNGHDLSAQQTKSLFENRYIEYTPVEAGAYTMHFSKSLIHPSGKTITYESEVSFTVLP